MPLVCTGDIPFEDGLTCVFVCLGPIFVSTFLSSFVVSTFVITREFLWMAEIDPVLRQAIRKHRRIFVEIALTAFFLGILCALAGVGIVGASLYWWLWSPQALAFALYVLTCVVMFHMSEFLVAAALRPHDTHPKAFMIYHSHAYTIASCAAVTEYAVETLIVPPEWKLFQTTNAIAITAAVAVSVFYVIRVVAMVQCGPNFSLEIETTHRDDHELVTSGVFGYLRHPSYFGWFWRTVLSQVLLMNPICMIGFTLVTWKFFVERIEKEEQILASDDFFGEKYVAYRKSVGTGIPFIP